MYDLLVDALVDSAALLPFLLVIYCLVEFFERRFGKLLEEMLAKAPRAGVLVGAIFGCVPQCGFSVVASALYARRLISTGTLLAVFLATSDEAIPVFLAQPEKGGLVLRLLVVKLTIGIVGGYAVDLLLGSRRARPKLKIILPLAESAERGCCQHHLSGESSRWQLFTHPLIHTLKVFFFIFAVAFGLNYLIAQVGEANLGHVLLRQSIFQPFLAALIGLIPNCAASVAIAEAFLKGGLGFGSTIAGLSCSAGLGLLVLFKENHDLTDTVRVLGLLVTIGVLAGLLIQLLYN
ncbi:MAG: arsenic efflux protein [Proteobacteria bacterium]|nr:arsenic efflux protein [Pseudomonadota bacterium]MBU1714223.1 arsenic efflux protein [Pseudomonadota bacterium]